MWIWVVLLLVVMVAVLYVAQVRRRARAKVSAERIEEFDVRLSHDARVPVGAAIARGKKVLAIKLYRESTGADLATSRAAVEKWYRGIHG